MRKGDADEMGRESEAACRAGAGVGTRSVMGVSLVFLNNTTNYTQNTITTTGFYKYEVVDGQK